MSRISSSKRTRLGMLLPAPGKTSQIPAVATVSIGGARNAGLLAVRILAVSDPGLRKGIVAFQNELAESVLAKDSALKQRQGKVTDE